MIFLILAFAMDQDKPDYDMDSEDEKWINQQARKMEITQLQFEEVMDRLEKSSGQQVIMIVFIILIYNIRVYLFKMLYVYLLQNLNSY